MRLRAVATPEVIGFHPEAIPVEPLEGGLVQADEQVARDGSVGIAVAANGKRGRFLDAAFGHGNEAARVPLPRRIRAASTPEARAEFAGEVHAHARETFE